MKRGLVLTLIFCMCVSFSSYASMITSLKCYNDKDEGIVYFFGKFSEDAKDLKDAGFKINNRYFSLNKKDENNPSKTGFQVALENDNVFGIGIKNTDIVFGSEFVATPYIENDKGIELMNESISFTKYNKNPQMVAAYAVEYKNPECYAPEDFKQITNTFNYTLETCKSTNNEIYSNREVLLKYDISDFDGVNEKNKVTLKINVIAKEPETSSASSKGGKIKVLTVESEEYNADISYFYNESSRIVSTKEIEKTYYNIKQGKYEEFTFDVTEIVNSKLKNNKSSVTFVIQLYNDKVRENAYVAFEDNYRPQLTIE